MLIRTIASLLVPDGGEIVIGGKRLHGDVDFPESIGILIENPKFLDWYTGFKNLELLVSLNNICSEEDIELALSRVGLDPKLKIPYRKYSLGMKQRLGIAACPIEHPQLILLDEPTNALDEKALGRLSEILREEKERGALVVLASHNRGFLEGVADRLYELESGKIVGERSLS